MNFSTRVDWRFKALLCMIIITLGVLIPGDGDIRASGPPDDEDVISATGNGTNKVYLPIISSTPQSLDDEVKEETIAYLGETPTTTILVDPITLTDEWGFGSVFIEAPDIEDGEPHGMLFLARKIGQQWEVAIQHTSLFEFWVQETPPDVISDDVKPYITKSGLDAMGNGSAQLSLPWKTGETWWFTGGPHNSGGYSSHPWSALDFSGGSGQVRAAREGTVWRSSACKNFVRIDHGSGWQTGYYHLTNIQVSNGQNVSRGQYLGNISTQTGCGGRATGPHVHFSVRRSNSHQNLDGHDIGGWTVQEWSKQYQGCLKKAGASRCVRSQIYNDGMVGSSTPLPPITSSGNEYIIEKPTLHQPYNNDVCTSYWYARTNNRGHTAYLTLNTNEAWRSYNSAEWKPNLQPGTYAIYAYIFRHGSLKWPCASQRWIYGDTEDARYNISYNGTSTTVSRNQLPVSDDWLYIGTFKNPTKVTLSDLNGQTNWTRFVSFSAMKFVRLEKEILGRVVVQGTNTPIENVTVSAGSYSAKTDKNGEYRLYVLPGIYSVKAQKEGYTFVDSPRTIYIKGTTVRATKNFYGKVIPPPPPPQPVVLVHGIQLQSPSGYECKTKPELYPERKSTLGKLAEVLKPTHKVWIAYLTTNSFKTPTLEDNGECLRKQIEYAYQNSGKQKVTIVAHSMGGVVSRACLSQWKCRRHVKALYTLGSPHAGVNIATILKTHASIAGLIAHKTIFCRFHKGACQLGSDEMLAFNLLNRNQASIGYTFIGGEAKHAKSYSLVKYIEGPNDGFIGKYSAVGWVYPFTKFSTGWSKSSPPKQYWFIASHIKDWGQAYYDKSDVQDCIIKEGECPNNLNKTRSRDLDGLQTEIDLSETTMNFSGLIAAHQLVTYTVPVDSSGHTVFILTASEGTPNLQLTQPDGQVIDPNDPNVTYEVMSEANELLPPMATYTISQTQPGTWTVAINVADLGTDPAGFTTFVALESSRKMVFESDKKVYRIGDTANFTVTIQDGSRGISGTNVTALLSRFDNITETITFVDQGDGVYTVDYSIPNAPGYLQLAVFGEGVDQGIEFNRQIDTLLTIMSPSAQLENQYHDYGKDMDGDGLYEALILEASIQATQAGTYTIHANLAVSDTVIASTSVYTVLQTGRQTVTLPFDGRDIYLNELDGPYTVSNLSITDIENGGVTAIDADNVWTTQYYEWRDFGFSGSSAIAIFQDTYIEHDNWLYDGDLGAFNLATGEATTYEGLHAGSYTIHQNPTSFPGSEIVLLTVTCKDLYGQPVEFGLDRDNFEVTIAVEEDQFLICTFVNEAADVEK